MNKRELKKTGNGIFRSSFFDGSELTEYSILVILSVKWIVCQNKNGEEIKMLFRSKEKLKQSAESTEPMEPIWNLTESKFKKKIAVVGIGRGAGATFVSVSLAFLLSMSKSVKKDESAIMPAKVSLLEMRCPQAGEPMLYYAAGLDRRFPERRFTDFFSMHIQGNAIPKMVNLHKGINWLVWRQHHVSVENTGKTDLSDFPVEQMAGEYIIADSPPAETLGRYDLVVAVIDPLPSSIFAGSEYYEQLRDAEAAGMHILWVLNKDHSEVNHSAVKRFLRLKEYVSFPLLESPLFYKAQYTCQLPAELLEGDAEEAAKNLVEKVRSCF